METKEKYVSSKKIKEAIMGKHKNFDDFDLAFLKKYERYLRDDLKNKPNTIQI